VKFANNGGHIRASEKYWANFISPAPTPPPKNLFLSPTAMINYPVFKNSSFDTNAKRFGKNKFVRSSFLQSKPTKKYKIIID